MKFKLDEVFVEEACRTAAVVQRVQAKLPPEVRVRYVADGRDAARPQTDAADPFAAGKRRLVLMRRRVPFLMGCPAGSTEFACCGYLVLVLSSNCPMDCSYCFLQEYVADNPGFQIYANYADAFEELDRLGRNAPGRSFRVGTGELADSLAFDSLTGISRDLVEYFAGRDNLLLELKTKSDEIEELLRIDSRGHTLVSWTLSPARVQTVSEHHTASLAARIAASSRVLDAGYRVGFHLDPIIAYPDAEHDYCEMIDNLFDVIDPKHVAFVSMGGLRMTPKLRAAARRRFPNDPLLVGEEVLAADGRYRTFTPLRGRLFSSIREHVARRAPRTQIYLCMENAIMHQRVFGSVPPSASLLGARLANG